MAVTGQTLRNAMVTYYRNDQGQYYGYCTFNIERQSTDPQYVMVPRTCVLGTFLDTMLTAEEKLRSGAFPQSPDGGTQDADGQYSVHFYGGEQI